MASSDSKPVPQKNVAYRAVFPILDADGDLVTGAAGLDSEVSKDQGTFADCTSEATEIATASGMYYLDLTATEMNADCVAIIVKTSTSGAKTTVLVFYPEETGDIRANATAALGTAFTEGAAGRLAGSISTFGNVITPVFTAASVNQSGDGYVKINRLDTDYTTARAGKLDNLDVTVGSRSTYAGADTAGTTTLLGRLTVTRAGNLDNLDAAISTRQAADANLSTMAVRWLGMVQLDGAVYQYTANALELGPAGGGGSSLTPQDVADAMKLAPTAGAPAVGSVYADLNSLIAAGAGGIPGPGADSVTVLITEDGTLGGTPVADADVWISTDASGDNVIAGTIQSDSAGQVTFLLDAGLTYYLWAQKDAWEGIRGQSFVAVAD